MNGAKEVAEQVAELFIASLVSPMLLWAKQGVNPEYRLGVNPEQLQAWAQNQTNKLN